MGVCDPHGGVWSTRGRVIHRTINQHNQPPLCSMLRRGAVPWGRASTHLAWAIQRECRRRWSDEATVEPTPEEHDHHRADPPVDLIHRIIRVDHAGEYGAERIYKGQLAVLRGTAVEPTIQEMYEQEVGHLEAMEEFMRSYRVRPTVLMPLWDVAGFLLGAGTALMGRRAAMACTVAVEEVITDHYNDQIRSLYTFGLKEKEETLRTTLRRLRDDEMHHRDTGLAHEAEQAPFYHALSTVIKAGCHTAIWLSTRI